MSTAADGSPSRPTVRVAPLAAVLLGLLLVSRFAGLTDRPLHHDEGVNGWKTEQLIVHGTWVYDPTNYHGPTLYFAQLVITGVAWLAGGARGPLLDGLTEGTLRVGVALAGWLMLVGLWSARRHVGRFGALAAVALAGVSPGLLYYSRDFIHETYMLLFTLVAWLGLARFAEGGGKGSLLLGSAALSLGVCTKETFAISAGALALSAGVAALAGRLPAGSGPGRVAALRAEAVALWRRALPHLWDAALVATAIWFALFSAFLRNPRGPIDSLRAFLPWARTAVESGHDKAWSWYMTALIGPWEPALAAGGALGLAVALWRRERIGLFLATWSAVVLAAYSAIPYKTPWLVLNALLPMALLGGWGAERLATAAAGWPGARVPVLGALGLGGLALLAWQGARARTLAYVEYEHPEHAYVYVQTRNDARRLLSRIDAEADPERPGALTIDVVSEHYWPLPFYLRRYQARFWGTMEGVTIDAPLVIGDVRERTRLAERLGAGWERLTYDLRPGVELDLFFRPRGGAPGG